jgi:DNA-directed RNA polymerase specialized sigma24 family protein
MELCDDSYEVFRRALVESDADAWELIASRYRNLLISWVRRCQASHATQESSEDLADWALARAWAALTPERFATFPNVAALLGYLRICVTTTVMDALRAQAAQERAIQRIERADVVLPEVAVLERLDRAELWETLAHLVTSENDRTVLIERFVLDLPPRVIKARHPALFADVSVVYASIRNLCDRLQRNRDLQRMYAERRMAQG